MRVGVLPDRQRRSVAGPAAETDSALRQEREQRTVGHQDLAVVEVRSQSRMKNTEVPQIGRGSSVLSTLRIEELTVVVGVVVAAAKTPMGRDGYNVPF